MEVIMPKTTQYEVPKKAPSATGKQVQEAAAAAPSAQQAAPEIDLTKIAAVIKESVPKLDLAEIKENMVTKEDLSETKSAIETKMVTKEDLAEAKSDIETKMVTKEDLAETRSEEKIERAKRETQKAREQTEFIKGVGITLILFIVLASIILIAFSLVQIYNNKVAAVESQQIITELMSSEEENEAVAAAMPPRQRSRSSGGVSAERSGGGALRGGRIPDATRWWRENLIPFSKIG